MDLLDNIYLSCAVYLDKPISRESINYVREIPDEEAWQDLIKNNFENAKKVVRDRFVEDYNEDRIDIDTSEVRIECQPAAKRL